MDLKYRTVATRKGLRPYHIQDERRGCAGERGEAEENCGQEHDGDAQRNGRILEIGLVGRSNYTLRLNFKASYDAVTREKHRQYLTL